MEPHVITIADIERMKTEIVSVAESGPENRDLLGMMAERFNIEEDALQNLVFSQGDTFKRMLEIYPVHRCIDLLISTTLYYGLELQKQYGEQTTVE